MATQSWKDIKRRRYSDEKIAELRAQALEEMLEEDLASVRELAGKTQAEVADALGAAQSQISRIETREDHRVSTLKAYIESLGGELEVIARFGDKSVRLRNV